MNKLKVCIAIDSFKGSMSSMQAGMAAKRGIIKAVPDAEVWVYPLADGGEGTTEALVAGARGEMRSAQVVDALGRPISARYGVLGGKTAVIEMAAAAGLPQIEEGKRNPMKTSTYGLGLMIKDAVRAGCRDFVIGLGGSATNDAGIGMLVALGAAFKDAAGNPVPPGAEGIAAIKDIDLSGLMPELKGCSFKAACDVDSPLCGPRGCSAVFGPQKGAGPEQVAAMDAALKMFAALVKQHFPGSDPDLPGSGAAGGLGYGLRTFLGAELVPGTDLVLDTLGIEQGIRQADAILTGEGRIDSQTLMGKAPAGIIRLARKYNKKIIALAGCVSDDAPAELFPIHVITPPGMPPEQAMQSDIAQSNMESTVYNLFN